MEQVQPGKPETKRATRSGWIYLAIIVAFLILAGVAAYLTYTNVKDFVAAWNMTDLPGIVVDPQAGATQVAPEIAPGVDTPPPPPPPRGAARPAAETPASTRSRVRTGRRSWWRRSIAGRSPRGSGSSTTPRPAACCWG